MSTTERMAAALDFFLAIAPPANIRLEEAFVRQRIN
jgi:hypothetical protein